MANFTFLLAKSEYSMFAQACVEAEKVLHTSPAMCAIGTRKALEMAVKWVYSIDASFDILYNDQLQTLVHGNSFVKFVRLLPQEKLQFIIKLGNKAVHTDSNIKFPMALIALRNLFEFIQLLDYTYGSAYETRIFDDALIPQDRAKLDEAKIREQQSLIDIKDEEIKKLREELVAQAAELAARHAVSTSEQVFVPQPITEADTRKQYIDLDLQLMGWKFGQTVVEEYPVEDMENHPGQKGSVDYVLFGQDGLPLAVVEAKRTSLDVNKGRHQAKLYADCLERKFGRRPMIFNTNGFETYFWDDVTGPQRKVFSIFSQDDLEKLMQRRNNHQDLLTIQINNDITERYYQMEAVRSVCSGIQEGMRKFLLVMATGTGKTRTAVSLTDVLNRGHRITNILFLADRKELVKQAKEAFENFLPDLSLCNMLENKRDVHARAVFSTYQTMLNAIDRVKENDEVFFTPGHFDLIFIDEAHRSIFKAYKTIFNYFDGILVGLTATPKTEVDRNTYDFFDLQQDVPTYSYDYDTAVYKDKVLVPYYNIEVKTKFLTQGISYDELSEEDKARFEEDFEGKWGYVPDYIPESELNKYVTNKDTIDMMLQDLMNNGVKTNGGNQIGKTIIFCGSKDNAEQIVKRFNALYPQYNGKICQRIVSGDDYSQNLLDEFKSVQGEVLIAVSVDMLDTGIDVPECVNLVFFKKVYSKTKFWQMIGRGTRLCKELTCTDGQHGTYVGKKYFYIFDYLGNFDFFRENKYGREGAAGRSLNESIFIKKVQLIQCLQQGKYATPKFQDLRQGLVNEVTKQIKDLNRDLVTVREQRQYADKFGTENAFQDLTDVAVLELEQYLAALVMAEERDIYALQFDNFMYGIMVNSVIAPKAVYFAHRKLQATAKHLNEKTTIPQVHAKLPLITSIIDGSALGEISILDYERIRLGLRDLIKFLVEEPRERILTDLQDEVLARDVGLSMLEAEELVDYKEKVNQYILQNQDNLAIYKLRHNQTLTDEDLKNLAGILVGELGTAEDYYDNFGETPFGILVRQIVKLDREAAMLAFGDFINQQGLNQQQIVFVHKIVDYLVENGTMEVADLLNTPFDIPRSFLSLFDKKEQIQIRDMINGINTNAGDVETTAMWLRRYKSASYRMMKTPIQMVAEKSD